MKKISSYIWKYKIGFIVGVISLLISVTIDMIFPQISLHLIDDVVKNGKMEEFNTLLLCLLGCGIGRFLFQFIKEYSFDLMGSRVAANMRRDLLDHLQGLSADFYDRNNTGELMARLKDDIGNIWGALTYVCMLLIEIFYHTGMIIFLMFRIDPVLTIIPIVGIIVSGVLAVVLEKKMDPVYGEISEQNANINTIAEENLSGMRTVKAFAREKFEIKKFLDNNEKYYELNVKQSKVFAKYYPYFQVITKLLPILVLLLGGYRFIHGYLTIGALFAFLEYSMNIVWPMEMLGWLSNSFSSAVASNRKLRKLYSETASIQEIEEPIVLDAVKGKITFENVSFRKEDQVDILKNISFCVEPGKTIGIMGATGAGKTSIIQLLLRMYDATDGNIYLDDVNIKSLKLSQLRGNISHVMQDVFLFSDTISDNIRLGKKELVDMDIIRFSSRRAQASEFIEDMEDQYETVIGERGVGLSGGQKQRISIARALAKQNPVLIMDDSTSALDMETEHSIQQELKQLQNTTKIIVAHRISAVRNADEIIILNNGEICERGTHETLLAQKGLYYKTYMCQYGEYEPEREVAACQ